VGEQDEVDDSADTASSDDPSSETGDDPSSETGDDTASETTEADAAGGATSLEPGTDGAGGDSAMGSGGAGDMPTEMGSGGSTETETEPDPEPVVDPELIGWASVSDCGPFGTTGGGSGEATVTVTSGAQLREALTASGPQVIAVSGLIDSPGGLGGVSDKTLLGVDGAEIRGGFGLSGARNVIIKDIVFSDGADDTFELSGGTCVWFDHCEFRDGADGNLDIVRGSDLVTVSWSRFYYTRGHEHMLSNLCGNQQPRAEDEGKINITFHHNWWGAGVKERKPRVRYGKVHVFNNYYRYEPVPNDTGDSYQVAAGYMSKLLVENNYFDGSNTPIRWMSDENTAEVVERGNAFVGTSGEVVTRGAAFEPPYQYTMDQAEAIKDLVLAGAGAR
jgi:pectate lyase